MTTRKPLDQHDHAGAVGHVSGCPACEAIRRAEVLGSAAPVTVIASDEHVKGCYDAIEVYGIVHAQLERGEIEAAKNELHHAIKRMDARV